VVDAVFRTEGDNTVDVLPIEGIEEGSDPVAVTHGRMIATEAPRLVRKRPQTGARR
jgi:hypothetical protein